MEFEDFCQKKKRMCKEYIPCSNGCPLYSTRQSDLSHTGCAQWCLDNVELAEGIVDKWAKDNPILTNAMKFKEVFGVDLDYSFDHPGYLYIKELTQISSVDHTENIMKWLDSKDITPNFDYIKEARKWLESEYIALNKEE